MKTNLKLKFALFACFLCISSWVFAATSPVDMLQNTSNQLLGDLAKTTQRNDTILHNLVKRILIPHIDLNRMSALVVGKYWSAASDAQRSQFEEEFTHFVTRTYSNALSSYSNEKVRFFPIRGGVKGDHAEVKSAIDQTNGESVAVSYRLILSGGEWKVYDFSVEGVSIVENYRSQFAEVLRSNGLTGLIQRLKQQNQGQ
jgi:phospholipid transport system substrate-binding protein